MPVAAVSLLKQAKIHGNALVEFAWAEYCIWHLGPELKVAIDGRRETIYPDNVYQDYLHFSAADSQWDNIVDKYPTELALIRPGAIVTELMKHKVGWTMVYSDGLACIFVKKNSRLESILSHLPPTSESSRQPSLEFFP